ncbi:MAG: M48 family metalloprotease [Myxococcales bacterium]|nr:M48 family metalloprotease [Myxococcales bacterium]
MKAITSLACLACVLGFAVTSQAQLGKIGSKILREGNLEAAEKTVRAATLTDRQIERLGEQTAQYMDANNPVAPDGDPYAERLKRLVAPHLAEDGLKLNFKVYKVADLNAFAAPDGSVRVMAGLMDLMTDDELRSIVGHEIAHVKLEQSKKQFQKAYAVSAGRTAAEANTGSLSVIPEGELGDFVEGVLNAKFSRSDESGADEYGFKFMVKHSYDYHAMETAFAKLDILAGPQRQDALSATHPDPGDRAATARKRSETQDAKLAAETEAKKLAAEGEQAEQAEEEAPQQAEAPQPEGNESSEQAQK